MTPHVAEHDITLTVVESTTEVHERFARAVADELAAANSEGREICLILPVGPTAQYPILANICREERISWRNTFVCLMDEYLDWQGRPLPAHHPLSFRGIFEGFRQSLDGDLRLPDDHWTLPDPFEIDRAERFIAAHGGVDTCYGGVGVHGHVAFNEPPVSRFDRLSVGEFADSVTRVVALAEETVVMNATRSVGGCFERFPSMAVTIGMRQILSARRIRLFCDGGVWQQEAVRRAVAGPVDVSYPVTLLRQHADVTITADRVTAARAADR
jgi:glucosamine-6-phosphate deaminase